MAKVRFEDFIKFEAVIDKYLPETGEGENMATQAVTATNKLIYKWFNDGDVYDNVMSGLFGWFNDLSSFANWIHKYCKDVCGEILLGIADCYTEDEYTAMLYNLATEIFDEKYLEALKDRAAVGSIYDCDGPFVFEEMFVEEDEEEIW